MSTTFTPLRGEYDVFEAPTQVVPSNPIAVAQADMIAELARIVAPVISVSPSPGQFEDVADYVERMVRVMDRWLLAVGEEAQSNSTTQIDMGDFKDKFFEAVDGFATHELDRIAQDLADEHPDGQRYCPTRRGWYAVGR
jgi:hypothetical protein